MPQTLFRNIYLTVALTVAFFVVGSSRAHAQQLTAAEQSAWSQKLLNLIPNSLEGIRTIQDLDALPADSVYQVLTANWAKLTNSDVKQYILSCILQNDNSRVLDILDLGVMDTSIAVQNRALQYCESYGFDTFTEDYESYLKWRKSTEGKPLREVMLASMKAVVTALHEGDDARRTALLNILVRVNFNATSETSRTRRETALEAHLPDAIIPWIKQQNNLMWTGYQIIRNIKPGEEFLRKVILPLADAKMETSVRYQALNVLGSPENGWATSTLMKMMLSEYPEPAAEMIGQSLSQIGDPAVIPTFISIMETDNTQEGNRVIGNILSPMTGVSNAFVRDAAWWKAWWARNNKRFPPAVRATQVPRLAIKARPVQAPIQNGFAQPLQPHLRQIGGDAKRAYWFIDPRENAVRGAMFERATGLAPHLLKITNAKAAAPPDSPPPAPILGAAKPEHKPGDLPGLIVVLTADGDGASASTFWQEAAVKALGRNYLIAVVVAAKWVDNQSVVWVTAQDLKSVKEAKSTTEALVAEVVKDIEATNSFDTSRTFLHGVGAGGLAVYAASLEPKTPFKGFYILASTFKSAALPPLDKAATRRYLIQNAREDKLHPFWMAEAAQKLLTQKTAVVKLDPTAGYLGALPQDTINAQIKSSFDWLASTR